MARQTWNRFALGFVLLGACTVLAVHAAEAPVRTGTATVQLVAPGKPALSLDAKTLAGMPHEQVTAAAHDEPASQWGGVRLEDILSRAGVPLDKPLRGKTLASFVRVTAADQYQVVFGLADLDATLGHTQVLLVDTRDGKPLDKDGPLRLLVPGDKRPARWVRNVTMIEVVDGGTTQRP